MMKKRKNKVPPPIDSDKAQEVPNDNDVKVKLLLFKF